MIKIIDNVLSPVEFWKLKDIYDHNYPWHYMPFTSNDDKRLKDSNRYNLFCNIILGDAAPDVINKNIIHKDTGYMHDYFKDLFENKIYNKLLVNGLNRLKIVKDNTPFFTTRLRSNLYTPGLSTGWHVDDDGYDHSYSVVYNIDEADGGTEIVVNNNKKIIVENKPNRLVFFKSDLLHTSVTNTSDIRRSINWCWRYYDNDVFNILGIKNG